MLTATFLTLFTTALAAPQLASRQAGGEILPTSIISRTYSPTPFYHLPPSQKYKKS